MGSSRWTAESIPDQTGRVVLISGANSGIGKDTARILAGRGAHVLLAVRNTDKGAQAAQAIKDTGATGEVEVVQLDLADLDSVRSAAADVRDRFDHLDLLINNAGLMATPKGETAQGFETQVGVNHLGHFVLTDELLPLLIGTPGSRVVTVSSLAHRGGRLKVEQLASTEDYSPWRAYSNSKLANLVFAGELQRRLHSAGLGTLSLAAHPGMSRTNLGRQSSGGVLGAARSVTRPAFELLLQPASMGSLPTLRAATDPDALGGEYYGPDGIAEIRGHPKAVARSARAKDEKLARQLWERSVELTGARYETLSG